MAEKRAWLTDPKSGQKYFSWSHVKSIFYDKAKNILLKDKLDDIDSVIAEHTDTIINKLVTNDKFNAEIQKYILKTAISNVQINDQNRVPSSALVNTMQNSISSLNSKASKIVARSEITVVTFGSGENGIFIQATETSGNSFWIRADSKKRALTAAASFDGVWLPEKEIIKF